MTSGAVPDAGGPDAGRPDAGRLDNGLFAVAYVPLTDVQVAVGRHLLSALARARIAAYLAATVGAPDDQRRLFVNADERADARTVVAAAVRALDGVPPADLTEQALAAQDPLAGVDTDAAFAALVADWHVDTVAAIREAERELSREDADWRAGLERPPVEEPVWLDDDHYVPPPPPPLPRLSAPAVGAISLIVASILLLIFGGLLDLSGDFTLLLGVTGLLTGAGILVMRLHDRDEDDGDGAVL